MARKRTKVGKYKTVFRGKRFVVQQATAILPSGKKVIFERVLKGPGVVILAFDSKHRILLTREYRAHLKKYAWRFPAGGGEKGESLAQTAQRELQEETGFKAKKMKIYYRFQDGGGLVKKRVAFVARNLVPSSLKGDEDEDIRVFPTPVSKVFKMVLAGKIEHPYYVFVILKLHREWKQIKKWLASN